MFLMPEIDGIYWPGSNCFRLCSMQYCKFSQHFISKLLLRKHQVTQHGNYYYIFCFIDIIGAELVVKENFARHRPQIPRQISYLLSSVGSNFVLKGKHYCYLSGCRFISSTRHSWDVHHCMSHQPPPAMKIAPLYRVMKHFFRVFPARLDRRYKRNQQKSYEHEVFQINECYAQPATDFKARNDLFKSDRGLNEFYDREDTENWAKFMYTLCKGFLRLSTCRANESGTTF